MNNLINMSEGTYLALHGLVLITKKSPERVNVKTLAKLLQSSEAHLAKVFQNLSKAGIVKSVRGPAGGFVLKHSPDDINFLDIFEIIEGKVVIEKCPFGKADCAFESCIFSSKLNRISQEIYDVYKNLKLADFQ
jgi:Rrf2 family protein